MRIFNSIFYLCLCFNLCFLVNCNEIRSENKYTTGRSRKFSSNGEGTDTSDIESLLQESCDNDVTCLKIAMEDGMGLEAIKTLHRQLDDDASGAIDLSESSDFLREELKYENGAEKRQRAFHRNDDMHISVKELWEAWVRSEVHNWTVEQTAEWLCTHVELPQYVASFMLNKVTGAHLPRLAVGNNQYITNTLGIKDPIHKQKIILKAMDVVLFGPPKVDNNNYIKDGVLVALLVGASAACYYAYRQNNRSKGHLNRMMKDMESLQKAELDLKDLQKELERAKQEQEYATTEKRNLEKKLQEQTNDVSDMRSSSSDLEVTQLKAEIEVLRNALQRAEGELVDRYWSPPPGLQLWLQLTHEIENKAYCKKKAAAEKQLQMAREACEKLKKKRSSLVGAFVSTHGKSIDDVDRSIVDARTSLNEVTQDLAERVHRWKQIENLCGFPIINNKGLTYLEGVLYRNNANGRSLAFKSRLSSQDNVVDDDSVSSCSIPAGVACVDHFRYESGGLNHLAEGQDISDSSEKLDHDDDNNDNNVHFTVGSTESEESYKRFSASSINKEKDVGSKLTRLTRSATEDADCPSSLDSEFPSRLSSNYLDPATMQKIRRPPRKSELVHSASVGAAIDEETASTDSNPNTSEDRMVEPVKKSKSKLKFPKFGRKSPKISNSYSLTAVTP